MDEDNVNPSEINSFRLGKALNNGISDKKRKLQAEQLGLPISKHKCWDHHLPSEPLISLDEGREVQKLIVKEIRENEKMQAEGGSSDPESAKGSNSFVGDSDSAVSAYSDVKYETEAAKMWLDDRPSTSSASWGYKMANDYWCSSDPATASMGSGKEKLLYVAGENNPLLTYEAEPMLEFGPHLDYSSLQYGHDSIEPYADEEMIDSLYPYGGNPNIYVLSSGRWSINQDAQPGTRKPTIDQEFEQYFSSLML